ncbi:MAG: NYN domain-containing protein [Solirubrobacterales bacterium]
MRWIVDGMNVIGTRPDGWWKDRHGAMVRLVDLLERFAAATGAEVTVVFERPPSPPIRSPVVEVAHAPRPGRDSADAEIVRRLRADPDPAGIRVVTSDRALADQARFLDALVEPAEAFRREIEGD